MFYFVTLMNFKCDPDPSHHLYFVLLFFVSFLVLHLMLLICFSCHLKLPRLALVGPFSFRVPGLSTQPFH